jgi:hypothetical protein
LLSTSFAIISRYSLNCWLVMSLFISLSFLSGERFVFCLLPLPYVYIIARTPCFVNRFLENFLKKFDIFFIQKASDLSEAVLVSGRKFTLEGLFF